MPEADFLILIGFSKGAPDSLEALVNYPEVAENDSVAPIEQDKS